MFLYPTGLNRNDDAFLGGRGVGDLNEEMTIQQNKVAAAITYHPLLMIFILIVKFGKPWWSNTWMLPNCTKLSPAPPGLFFFFLDLISSPLLNSFLKLGMKQRIRFWTKKLLPAHRTKKLKVGWQSFPSNWFIFLISLSRLDFLYTKFQKWSKEDSLESETV